VVEEFQGDSSEIIVEELGASLENPSEAKPAFVECDLVRHAALSVFFADAPGRQPVLQHSRFVADNLGELVALDRSIGMVARRGW